MMKLDRIIAGAEVRSLPLPEDGWGVEVRRPADPSLIRRQVNQAKIAMALRYR
jgi:hypothetical protein